MAISVACPDCRAIFHVSDEAASKSIASRDEAYASALSLRDQGRLEEATFYFINALARAPGSVNIIAEYAATVREMARQSDAAEAARKLEWVEAFVRERIAHVDPQEIPSLLTLAAAVNGQRESLARPAEAAIDQEETVLAEQLGLLRHGQFDRDIPDSREGIETRLVQLECVRDYAVSDGEPRESKLIGLLETLIELFRTTLQVESLLREGKDLLNLAADQLSPTASSYCLQLCETALRQLLVLKNRVDGMRQERIDQLLEDLKAGSELVTKRESESLWTAFERIRQAELTTVQSWKAPSHADPDSACQQQLDRIRHLGEQVQAVLPRLSHADISRRAVALMADLSKAAINAGVEQQKRYNRWAIARIQGCLSTGLKCVGMVSVLNDKTGVGNAIVGELGPIDTRMLTMEVQRCYHEVFEHLFGQLGSPNSSDDFNTDGCKLKVLRDMFDQAKKEPGDF